MSLNNKRCLNFAKALAFASGHAAVFVSTVGFEILEYFETPSAEIFSQSSHESNHNIDGLSASARARS